MKWKVPIYTAAFLLLTGCYSSSGTTEKEENGDVNQASQLATAQSEPDDKLVTAMEPQQEVSSEEIIVETENQLNTGVPVKLPMDLAVTPGHYLTAKTSAKQLQYSIMFFETLQPISINHKELENKEANIATLNAKRYETPEQAANQINHQIHKNNGAQSVDLEFGIKGYRDAGAGSQFIGWNEGRWSLDMRATTAQGKEIEKEAKEVVQFLEKHTLPIPHEWGAIKLDVSNSKETHQQQITWQEKGIVYEIITNKNAIAALEIAVSIQESSLKN